MKLPSPNRIDKNRQDLQNLRTKTKGEFEQIKNDDNLQYPILSFNQWFWYCLLVNNILRGKPALPWHTLHDVFFPWNVGFPQEEFFPKAIVKGPETLIVSVPFLSIVTRWVRCMRPWPLTSQVLIVITGLSRSNPSVITTLTSPWDWFSQNLTSDMSFGSISDSEVNATSRTTLGRPLPQSSRVRCVWEITSFCPVCAAEGRFSQEVQAVF